MKNFIFYCPNYFKIIKRTNLRLRNILSLNSQSKPQRNNVSDWINEPQTRPRKT